MDFASARTPEEEAFAAELREHLLRAFGPGSGRRITLEEIERQVLAALRAVDDPQEPPFLTGITPAAARSMGWHVPDDVPDWAVFEFHGVDAAHGNEPGRVTVSTRGRWVWDQIEITAPAAS